MVETYHITDYYIDRSSSILSIFVRYFNGNLQTLVLLAIEYPAWIYILNTY